MSGPEDIIQVEQNSDAVAQPEHEIVKVLQDKFTDVKIHITKEQQQKMQQKAEKKANSIELVPRGFKPPVGQSFAAVAFVPNKQNNDEIALISLGCYPTADEARTAALGAKIDIGALCLLPVGVWQVLPPSNKTYHDTKLKAIFAKKSEEEEEAIYKLKQRAEQAQVDTTFQPPL